MTALEIGTVEVLRLRIYDRPGGGAAAVPPGSYPLYSEEDGTIRWVMTGRPSERRGGRVESLGDGLFSVGAPYDHITGNDDVPIPGRGFTRAEFRDFLTTDPVVREGDPEQRLRVRVLVEV